MKEIKAGKPVTTIHADQILSKLDYEKLSQDELRNYVLEVDFLNTAIPDNFDNSYSEELQNLSTQLKKFYFKKFNEKAVP